MPKGSYQPGLEFLRVGGLVSSRADLTAMAQPFMLSGNEVFVTASAIGWYGIRGDELLDEGSEGRDCFSREVCLGIEAAAQEVEALGIRTVRLRIGLVLDRS